MKTSESLQNKLGQINCEQSRPSSCFELIQKVGSSGRYQQNIFYFFVSIFILAGCILQSTSFLFMNNQYVCEDQGLLVTACKKTVCQISDKEERKKYFLKNSENIKSVATDFGPFICEDQYLLDMIKSCPYFGSLLGFVVFSYVSDNIGRKKTIVTSLGISTVGSLLVVTGFNLPMIAVGVIMSGAGINVALSMALCFMGEVIDNYKRQKYSILMQSGYTIGCMIMTGLYYFLGNWRIVTVIIQAVPITLTFLTFTFYAEETPFFLLRGKTSEALKSLNRIGKINFKIQDILTEEDIESVKRELITKTPEQGNRVSPWDLMRFRSLRTTTLLTSVLGFVILSMYYGPALSIGSIGFNTYVTNIAILFSDLIGIIPCYYYIDKVQRRMTGLAMFSVTLVCSFILLFVEKQEKCELCTQSVIEVVVIFFFRFAVGIEFSLFLVYSIELFPIRVVGMASNVISVASTSASTLAPIILGLIQRLEFSLMLFFLILAMAGCAVSILLQETQGKPLREQIMEISNAKLMNQQKDSSAIKSSSNLEQNHIEQ